MAHFQDSVVDPGLMSRASSGMLAGYQPGQIVSWRFVPGIIVASFFASLTGTLLTVELLHRKRLGRSIMSRVHLFACAASMGLIGIWCMHFIGNRSIVLGNGDTRLQLIYSPGYTLLSCALPVIGLAVAFYIAELSIRSFILRRLLDVVTGLLAGLSIVGMHYVGNLGTMNYTLIYPSRYIIGSCIIAVGDCVIALALFFYFKERWIGVFWKRLFCAIILAVAVCGMHFTASIGCTYRLKSVSDTDATQRNTAVIIAGTLCCVAAVSVLIVLFYTTHRQKILTGRAQQVMLACAIFDVDGNIMVTNEGALPSQKIAKRFALKDFDDEFGVHHPVYHWIWKVSHNWGSVTDLIPKMRSHLRRHDPYIGKTSASSSTSSLFDEKSSNSSTVLFREGYCVAAADLAGHLRGSLESLGSLYDQVIGTGIIGPSGKVSQSHEYASTSSSVVLEKGQLLFFTRKLRSGEVDHFTAAGFRFAPYIRVEAVIARTMQIPTSLLHVQIEGLHQFACRNSTPPPEKEGVYFVCLAALARVRSSFLVLVQKDRQDELPDVQLSPNQLTQYQMDYLKTYNGWTAERFIKYVEWKDKNRHTLPNEEKAFIILLRNALASLVDLMGEDWFLDLIFSSQPLQMQYGKAQGSPRSTLFGFTRLLDIHHGILKQSDRLTLVNLDFVKLRKTYYTGCNDHGRMRHRVHAEFGPILTKHEEPRQSEEGRSSVAKVLNKQRHIRRQHSSGSHDSSIFRADSYSEGLVMGEEQEYDIESGTIRPTQPWGGILATTDTMIVESSKMHSNMEMKKMGPQVTATAVPRAREPSSYIDLLYVQAKSHPAQVPKTITST